MRDCEQKEEAEKMRGVIICISRRVCLLLVMIEADEYQYLAIEHWQWWHDALDQINLLK